MSSGCREGTRFDKITAVRLAATPLVPVPALSNWPPQLSGSEPSHN